MKVYESLWDNLTNRTMIINVLVIFWTLIIEMYFLFWSVEQIKENIFVSWLYFEPFNGISFSVIDLNGVTPLLGLFHLIIWGVCFFFTFITYSIAKEVTRSGEANITEYGIMVIVFAFFIMIVNGWPIGLGFVILAILEFLYLYLSLRNK